MCSVWEREYPESREVTFWVWSLSFVKMQVWILCHFLLSLDFFRKCWQHIKILNIKAVMLGCCQLISARPTRGFDGCPSIPYLSFSAEKSSWAPFLVLSRVTWKGETKEFPIGGKLREALWVSSFPSYLTFYLSFYCCHLSSYSFSCRVHYMDVATEHNLFFTFLMPRSCEKL